MRPLTWPRFVWLPCIPCWAPGFTRWFAASTARDSTTFSGSLPITSRARLLENRRPLWVSSRGRTGNGHVRNGVTAWCICILFIVSLCTRVSLNLLLISDGSPPAVCACLWCHRGIFQIQQCSCTSVFNTYNTFKYIFAGQRAKQQFTLLTQEPSRYAWLCLFAIRPQCLAG